MDAVSRPSRGRRWARNFLVWVLILFAGGFIYGKFFKRGGKPDGADVQPVRVAVAELRDVPQYFQGLGTALPNNTALVRSRVDGQLMALHFAEGQIVQEGALLAEIDSRPFAVQLKQSEGSLARDAALLKDARLDLVRYQKLIKEQSVSAQQLQAQESLVGQYEGTVQADQANVASARLQLDYCRIIAPIAGRVGLKQADLGNIVHATDATGIVTITQVRPMQVTFTLVEKQIPTVLASMKRAGEMNPAQPLVVEAWEQDNKKLLATGSLLTLDNQIDTTTGTVKAKALFTNAASELFPNQFVNARLLVRTLEGALTIPTAAVQRNNKGFFVYQVDDAKTVHMRPITPGYAAGETTVVEQGLEKGETVVTDGVDQLREGTRVRFELK